MSTHVTVNLDPTVFGLDGPAVSFEFDLDYDAEPKPADGPDDALLEVVFAICNSYPTELHCDPAYRNHVVRYRNRKHRSLSVGDTVTLTNDDRTRTYRCATFGFEEIA